VDGSDDIEAFVEQVAKKKGEQSLNHATALDRIIWDKVVFYEARHFEVLTLYTNDMQGNVLITWNTPRVFKKRNRVDIDPTQVDFNRALKNETIRSVELNYYRTRRVSEGKPRADSKYLLSIGYSQSTINEVYEHRAQLLLWNRFRVNGAIAERAITFQRMTVLGRHACRRQFQNLPLLSSSIWDNANCLREHSGTKKFDGSWAEIYSLLCKKEKGWVSAVGRPMSQNLTDLSAIVADKSRRVTLVTGLPGTGKENYCRALHFGGCDCHKKSESRLFLTTALHLERGGETISQKLLDLKKKGKTLRQVAATSAVTVIIDELNKAGDVFRSELLRVLEDPKQELNLKKDVQLILAASDHLERLAEDPPQDFWTRISNQHRVSHPLGRVSEEDAEAFLKAFFWWEWWKLVRDQVGTRDKKNSLEGRWIEQQNVANSLLGTLAAFGTKSEKRGLADVVEEEFVDSLAPLANRDELSIRGLRSIVAQLFSRVIWACRYQTSEKKRQAEGEGSKEESPFNKAVERTSPQIQSDDIESPEREVRRSVNRAIQDVLAILNATRATPRTAVPTDSATDKEKRRSGSDRA
jgi:hypothetical protein